MRTEAQRRAQHAYHRSPRGKFNRQKVRARERGISWCLTFEEWWEIWQKSGKWHLRGNKTWQYVMARYGDVGPYSPENVYIASFSENLNGARQKVLFNHTAKSAGVSYV